MALARSPVPAFLPLAAMLLAVTLWGGSFTATKAAVVTVPPVLFAFARFTLATSLLGLVHLATRQPLHIPRRLWPTVVWAGLLGTTATYVLENIALRFTTSGNSSLIIALSPLITAIGAVAFLGERLTWRMGLGSGIAVVGTVLLVGGDLGHTGLGDAIMLGATLVGVGYNLLSKRLADSLSPLRALTGTFAVGCAGLAPCALVEALVAPGPWHPTLVTAIALAYLGVGSSCLACWLWMFALGYLPASRATLFLYLMPLVTMASGHVLLGEHLGLDTGLEAGMILLGVSLAARAPAPAGPRTGEATGTGPL